MDSLTDSKRWSANIFMKTDMYDKNSLFNMKAKIMIGVLIIFIIILMANMLITPIKLTKRKKK